MPHNRPLTRREVDELNLVRLERHWSYRQLAELVELPISTVQRALKGHNPGDRTAFRLRQWLREHRAARAAHASAARAALGRLAAGGDA